MCATVAKVTRLFAASWHIQDESPSWGSHYRWIIDPDDGANTTYRDSS